MIARGLSVAIEPAGEVCKGAGDRGPSADGCARGGGLVDGGQNGGGLPGLAVEFLWGDDHIAQHGAKMMVLIQELGLFGRRQIFARPRSVDPVLRFGLFAVSVRELADKVRCIASLLPCFGNVCSHRAR